MSNWSRKVDSPEVDNCAGCGHSLRKDALACLQCGHVVKRVREMTATHSPAAAAALPASPPPPPPSKFTQRDGYHGYPAYQPERIYQAPLRPGSLVLRFFAAILDEIFLVPATILVVVMLGIDGVETHVSTSEAYIREFSRIWLDAFWWMVALHAGYFAIFEASSMKGTPGKWFLGLAVTDTDGNQLGLLHTLLRYALKVALQPFLIFSIVVAMVSSRNQAIYDHLLGTVVYSRDSLPSEPRAAEPPPGYPPAHPESSNSQEPSQEHSATSSL